MSASFFSGPLPPPETLQKYEAILPGITDRLVRLHEGTHVMALEQSQHRRSLESKVIEGNVKAQPRGQWMAFIIVIASLAAGTFLIYSGKRVEGLWAMFAPLGGVLGAFVLVRSKQDRELERKRKELANPTADD